jgi:ABC-2 type transport system permease protein
MMQHILSNEGRFRRIRALFIKEIYQIVRDPSTILISVVLPIILLFLYGYGVSLDLNHLRIGLVLEDTAPDAQSFAQTVMDSRYFDVKIVRDRRQLTDDLMRGDIRGYVVIPAYFSEFRKRPNQIAPIQVIADGSEPNTANFVQYYAQGALQVWLQQERIQRDISESIVVKLEPRFWYNEELESRYFLLSGSLAIIMTLIGTLLTALVIAREWERGTMEALMSTPVTRLELILGKMIPYFVLGMMSMAICVLVSTTWYGLPFRGSFFVLAGVAAAFLFCALGIGFVISTIAKNQLVASQISLVIAFLPSYILSGFLFEITSMPKWIQLLTYGVPAKYFVQCLQTLFLVGNVSSLILFNVAFMVAIGTLQFLFAYRKTVKKLE